MLAISFCLIGNFVAGEEPKQDNEQKVIAKLIKQLNDDSFGAREEAVELLDGYGVKAIPKLQKALAQRQPLEVKLRLQNLLAKYESLSNDLKIQAMVEATDDSIDHDLPNWKIWRKQIGSDAKSRELFANILRDDFEFMRAIHLDARAATKEYEIQVDSLVLDVLSPTRNNPLNSARLAAILFAGSNKQTGYDFRIASRIFSLLHRNETRKVIVEHPQGVQIMNLLVGWISQNSTHDSFRTQAIKLALNYHLDQLALSMARETLQSDVQSEYKVPNVVSAITTIAIAGGEKDKDLLRSSLENDTKCSAWPKEGIETQIRDVALGAILDMQRQDLREFGFKKVIGKTDPWYPVFSLGFPDDKSRNAAFEKWQSYEKTRRKD